MNQNKPHIGIIGAGASGLVTAWLLEQDYKVTLFEKENYLGGHVATIPVTIGGTEYHIESGAEFFSDMMFPEFNKLLQVLNVPTRKYPLSYTFYNTKTNQTLVLPPFQDGHILWRSCAPAHWFDLIHFKQFVDKGKTTVQMEDQDLTLKDYADEIGLPCAFKEQFLYPFFAASWGVTCEDIQQFAAYDIIKWVLLNKPANIHAAHWNEIPGGMHTYVNAIKNQLKNTQIITQCTVESIQNKHSGFDVVSSHGTIQCDHLVLATNAQIASDLLKDIPECISIRDALNNIEYFTAHIAVHGDARLMPQDRADWSAANIAFDNTHSALSISKPWMQQVRLFRSWITYNVWNDSPEIMPAPLYALRTFRHPKVTPAYFKTQKTIAHLQGKNNLWIAGFYTHDTDSHNSAIVSAINIAKKLAPNSSRLMRLRS
jgi:predicted NAD/FAD-binding protein